MGIRDTVIWTPSSSGRFSCRFFRKSIVRVRDISERWNILWEISVLLKVKCFMRLVIRDKVAVRDMLQKLGLVQSEKMFVRFLMKIKRKVDIFSFTMIGFIVCG